VTAPPGPDRNLRPWVGRLSLDAPTYLPVVLETRQAPSFFSFHGLGMPR